MGINFDRKLSQEDMNAANDILNPPQFEPGYGDGPSDQSFTDLFSDLDGGGEGLFGDLSGQSDGFGQSGGFGQSDGFGGQQGGFGQSGGFGGSSGGFGGQSGGFGSSSGDFGGLELGQNSLMAGQQQQAQQVQAKPDILDKGIEATSEAAVSLVHIIGELFKSLKLKNADDFGYLSRNYIMTGVGISIAGAVLSIIALIQGVPKLGFSGIGLHLIAAGIMGVGTGFIGIGFSAIKKLQCGSDNSTQISDLPDISEEISDDSTSDYEESIGDIMDDLFGDSFDLDGDSGSSEPTETELVAEQAQEVVPDFTNMQQINFDLALQNIHSNTYLTREVLFNTFLPFLPLNTAEFDKKTEIEKDDPLFAKVQYLALKALSNIVKCDVSDVKSSLTHLVETHFCYELTMTRIKGVNKTDDIAREMEIYFKDNSADESVNATVNIEMDDYKIIITKGESAVVTLKDAFSLPYVREFFLNEDKKLPMITGISELGEVVLDDAKIFDTMLIAGKPRSGKSWYVLSMLLSFMMFNTPEDIQFVIIDPKVSNLFKTISLLPHVAGLHDETNILEVLDDIIDNEAPRRKKIIAENHVEDIWMLRKKGVRLPLLYIFIDEFITAQESLGPASKDLNAKMRVIISQLPSLGIRLIFIAHRSTGVVDKTNRTLLQFTASIRGENEEVKETLGISKWTRALLLPGDTAVKASSRREAIFVKGIAVTPDDAQNTQLIESVAKAFYKMGVDMPDMSAMKIACNRNEDDIKQRLTGEGTRIQYDNWEDVSDDSLDSSSDELDLL